MRDKFIRTIQALYESWWIWGILGWTLVALNYPFADVLPVYAE